MTEESLSTTFPRQEDEITFVQKLEEFNTLRPNDMAKRETLGKRLKRAREDAGLTVPALCRKNQNTVKETTLRDYERDRMPNPGVKTLESIAVAYGLDPLEVITLVLDDPPEMESGFRASQFARLYEHYKKLDKEQKAFIDDYVETLIQKIDGWL